MSFLGTAVSACFSGRCFRGKSKSSGRRSKTAKHRSRDDNNDNNDNNDKEFDCSKELEEYIAARSAVAKAQTAWDTATTDKAIKSAETKFNKLADLMDAAEAKYKSCTERRAAKNPYAGMNRSTLEGWLEHGGARKRKTRRKTMRR